MGLGNISWGSVLVGAAAAVAIVAFAPEAVGLTGILASNATATYAGAAAVGGVAMEFLSDLVGRTGQAVTTIARG